MAKVDPQTGKVSRADNAIASSTYYDRRKVDPVTGERSDASNAVAFSSFRDRRKVDPITGQSSVADNAISFIAFRGRKKVNPLTGEASTADDAISYSAFKRRISRKKLKLMRGEAEHTSNTIPIDFSLKGERKVDPVELNEISSPIYSINVASQFTHSSISFFNPADISHQNSQKTIESSNEKMSISFLLNE